MFISIQQPEYFPWLGYFDKVRRVELVVILDSVQFKKRYFENRNRIRTAGGEAWIRTPVLSKGRFTQLIRDVEIDDAQPWRRTLVASLRHSYSRALYWKPCGEGVCELVESWRGDRLAEFNLAVIRWCLEQLGLHRPIRLASSLGLESHGSQLIFDICDRLGARRYLSGRDGRNYMDLEPFRAKGIEVEFQDFEHPVYPQVHGGEFLPAMSVIDLLCNMGPSGARAVLEGETTDGRLGRE